jgi:hypothetical protein
VLAEPNPGLSIAELTCCLVCSIGRALEHVARPTEDLCQRVLSQVSIAVFLWVRDRPFRRCWMISTGNHRCWDQSLGERSR